MKFIDDEDKDRIQVKCNVQNEWTSTGGVSFDWTDDEFKCQSGRYAHILYLLMHFKTFFTIYVYNPEAVCTNLPDLAVAPLGTVTGHSYTSKPK